MRIAKLVRLLGDPVYRSALRLGIGASVELEPLPFGDDIRTVIDVGANRGQFAAFALRRFPGALVHSFEPLAAPRSTLSRLAARAGRRVRVHAAALGAAEEERPMHVLSEDDSSSLLAPTAVQLARGMREVGLAPVAVRRLDMVLRPSDLRPRCLLKIDVQGSELDVLRGAAGLLGSIDEVLVECSYVAFYDRQPLAAEIVAYLRDHGFAARSELPSIHDEDRVLQADILFCRSSYPDRARSSD